MEIDASQSSDCEAVVQTMELVVTEWPSRFCSPRLSGVGGGDREPQVSKALAKQGVGHVRYYICLTIAN